MTEVLCDGPDDSGLLILRLNRPEARNALNLAMCHGLRAAMEAVDPANVRAVLIVAEGAVFCAGADLKERKGKDAAWVIARRRASFAAYAAIEACPVPVIAVLDGPVIGSGGEIAMACDFAVASHRARFRWPEIGWGAVGATQRLQRRIGIARAKELLMTGREMGVDEALATGLIARMSEDLDALVGDVLTPILAAPPLAMRLAKQAVDLGASTDLAHGIGIEALAIDRSLAATEWQEGLSAFRADHKSGGGAE